MSFWICPNCETASLTWPSLRWHIKGKHPGVEIPEKDVIQVTDESPEGFRVIGQPKKGAAAPPVTEGGEEVEKPLKEVTVPKELPEDFTERVKLSLSVHNFPDRLTSQVLNVLALHPETHDNPNNFANLLAHICSTYSGGVVHARKISLITSEVFGQPTSEVPYAGGYGTPAGGYYAPWQQPAGGYGAQPGAPPRYEDPITRWINYQMYKETKEEEKTKETKLPASIEAELSAMRKDYEAAVKQFEDVSAQLAKQDKRDEEAQRKAELAELRAEIRAASEGKKKGGESDWLQAYLTQRDKNEEDRDRRNQETIKSLGEKLAAGTKEVAETRREIDRKVADAITAERTVREQVKKELEASGYAPKTKTKDELDHEIQRTVLEVIPEKLDKGFDKIADKLGPFPGTVQSQAAATQQPARTPQEIAAQAEIEEGILDEARRRGRA